MADLNQSTIELEISMRPWAQIAVDAFVVPTNSQCLMSEFPASRIRALAGPSVERGLAGHTPLAIGAALVTDAGNMRARHLIHVANTEQPGGEVEVEGIRLAIQAALLACSVRGFSTLAVPLMGAFRHGIPSHEAARAIYSELRNARRRHPLRALLLARGDGEVALFETVFYRARDW